MDKKEQKLIQTEKLEKLKQNREIKKWFKDTKAAPATQHNCLQAMLQYTEFLNMTPEALLDEAEAEMQLSPRRRKLKDYIIDFREHLQKRGVADSTIKNRVASIRSFYVSNEMLFPKIRGEETTTLVENEKIPTKEDLQECLSVCDPLEKAVMLAGISSGMAATEIRHVTLQQFKDGYDSNSGITTISMKRQKTKVSFITFFSPEASRAIWEYLEYRDRSLKAVGSRRKEQIEKQRTTPDSYLFILQGVSKKYLESYDEKERQLTEDSILKLYRGIAEKARKNTKPGSYNYIRSHTMRKYFNSALLNAGCDAFTTEFWMGHKLSETQAAYFKANIHAQKELYKKYIPYLTIQKELDISTSPEYINAIERAEKAEAEAVRVSVEREELNRVRAQLESMSASFDSLWNMYQQDTKQQKPEAEKGLKKIKIIPSNLEPSREEDITEGFMYPNQPVEPVKRVRIKESL